MATYKNGNHFYKFEGRSQNASCNEFHKCFPKLTIFLQTNQNVSENFYNFSKIFRIMLIWADRRTNLFYIAGMPGVCGHVFWIQTILSVSLY